MLDVLDHPNGPPARPRSLRRQAGAALRWGGLCLVLALSGCASGQAKPAAAKRAQAKPAPQRVAAARPPTPRPVPLGSAAAWAGYDGPGDKHHTELAAVPDAEPVVEPVRADAGNRPYRVLGRSFQPLTEDLAHRESGLASWYGRKFHGRRTASGEAYDMHAMTAAHPTLPLPSYARVRNPGNGREVIVRINDRGPFHSGRIIDLSFAAASKLGLTHGPGKVEVERLTFEEIRTGAWRRTGPTPAVAPPAEPADALLARAPSGEAPTETAPPLPALLASAEPTAAGLPAADAVEPAASAASGNLAKSPMVATGRSYCVQLGAFRLRDGAEGFQRRVVSELQWLAPVLAVFNEADLHRLHAGPYRSPDEAHSVAQRVRGVLSLVPVVVERQ